MLLGVLIRFFVSESTDEGIGETPQFLFISQAILTFLFVGLLVCGELHKPAAIMMCFPLLMSRTGRGVIIVMFSLPLTNFLEAYTALIMIICVTMGSINIALGCKDGPVELKYAEEGVPERTAAPTSPPRNAGNVEGMRQVPQASPAPPNVNQQR